MSKDLRTFLDQLRREHSEELWEIEDQVSLEHEMTALALELEQQKKYPALLFKNVRSSGHPVVSNLFASRGRIARILGIPESDLLRSWGQLASRRQPPKVVKNGPVKEVVLKGETLDLRQLPIPTHFETDAGPYISAGVVIAKDPETGVGNLSYARLQVKSRNQMGVSLHSRGNLWDFQRRSELDTRPLEVAVAVGVHPIINIAAATRLPLGEDELAFAGGLLREAVPVVPAETVDLFVPAEAELVLEGVIEPGLREDEGPFGEYTGYSSARSTRNVFTVNAVTHRKDFIYHDIVPGATSEHLNLSKTSRVPQFFDAVRKVLPNVEAMNYPASGTHFHCYLSMEKTMDGQPRQAMTLLFGLDIYLKLIIVVDEEIDVFNDDQVLWALATRFQADRDLILISNSPCNLLDPSTKNGLGAKLGLDATRKFGPEVERLGFSSEMADRAGRIISNLLGK